MKKLLKYLYGLKQAGFEWQKLVTSDLISAGYDQSQADPLIFSMWRNPKTGEKTEGGTGEFIIFSLHVDDFYCITDSDRLKKELIDFLKLKYKNIKVHEGNTLTYLGVLVSTERNGDVV